MLSGRLWRVIPVCHWPDVENFRHSDLDEQAGERVFTRADTCRYLENLIPSHRAAQPYDSRKATDTPRAAVGILADSSSACLVCRRGGGEGAH
ncbi:hypothetical protein JZ751_015329 [Albula glossodonta]|uniref:Uncharacterized protein n=1 Tax=Albula glossodonta TaxID=121402 RepID=A0A8T2MQX1_9TELE|nr:hypothetical protein JZ751_015329 [Albula glossodonta]